MFGYMPKKLTTEEWVARAIAIHGDRYEYSKTEYVNFNTMKIAGTLLVNLIQIFGPEAAACCHEALQRKLLVK